MKAQWLATIALIVMCLVSSPACCLAGSQCQPGVVVKFGNGVWNDEDAATSSSHLFQLRLESKISGTDLDGVVEYDLSFNPSAGVLLDLLETYGQNRRTDWTLFWRYLAALDLMPDFLQDKIKDIASTVDAAAIQANPAVQKHIANYNALLSEGNKVVLVAHSQGNLFANIAYPGIDPEYIDGFGIVSVGNPDNYVADDGPYTTLTEDIVIGIVPFSLPANINNFFGINWHDWSGHKFADSYMASGREAETKILDDTINMINKLNAPPYTPVTIAIELYGELYDPSGRSTEYRPVKGDSKYLLWNSECAEPFQVKKTGGGFWSYPLTEEEYNGSFLSDLEAMTGQSISTATPPHLLTSKQVETTMRKDSPNLSAESGGSNSGEQHYGLSSYRPVLTTPFDPGPGNCATAVTEAFNYVEANRTTNGLPGQQSVGTRNFQETNKTAINNAGLTDTWSESQTRTFAGNNQLTYEDYTFCGDYEGGGYI